MDDTAPTGADEGQAPTRSADDATPRRGFLRRHWGKVTLTTVVLVPSVAFAIWVAVTLGYTYSSGERVGFVQKLSKEGWICKTWEGELQMSNVPGSAPILFQFTVRGDSLAHAIEAVEGRQVALVYEQHVGVPTSCIGDTEYFVTGVRALGTR